MEQPEGNTWLDTETKALLQRVPPRKLAPAGVQAFSVIVLSGGDECDNIRRIRAFQRVLRCSRAEALDRAKTTPPSVLQRRLSLSDALLAQFELICGDIVSVFISDEVVSSAESGYLADLYETLLHADEFQEVTVRVGCLPLRDAGRAFTEQFIGSDLPPLPFKLTVMRKKARIMCHWAAKVGGIIDILPQQHD